MEKAENKDNLSPDISDDDIFEAMKDIQGYIDVTPADLKEIFRFAYRHAVDRLSRSVKAADIMTRAVYFVRTHTPLREVAAIMAANRISGVPVIDDAGGIAGVISEKDFLARMGSVESANVMGIIASCLEGTGCLVTPIRRGRALDIMASPAVTVNEDTSALEIAEIFNAKKINRVPVIDSSGRITGIVSRADILRGGLTGLR